MKRAFISLSDKTGVVDFAKELVELGYEIVSTGGTRKVLSEAGIGVTNVSSVTGFPECLDGRVKTLHPKIHAGILAMRSNAEHMRQLEELGVNPIDVVAVNLYPFKATISKENVEFAEAIENIDIGGPTMIRAAAKNYQDVAVIVDSADYPRVIAELKEKGEVSMETKLRLCAKVFEHTAAYDALISGYLRERLNDDFPDKLTLTFEKAQEMRYGENPHQRAVFYREPLKCENSLTSAVQLNGKELSFNNINDTNGALDLLREFDETACVAVKHANPCGVACADNLYDAYMRAYECDPVSIFGGIVAVNDKVDEKTAAEMVKTFLEIIVAPSYEPEALEILRQKKNLRVLELPGISAALKPKCFDMKKVVGGLLMQDIDRELFENDMKVVTKAAPDKKQIEDLLFAWKVVKHMKSNAISICRDKRTLGLGPGQVSRIWAAQDALERCADARGAVMASDAFFPFPDCVEEAHKAGVTCIIQPGGSKNDQASIDACNEAGVAMVFTGMRHFKH